MVMHPAWTALHSLNSSKVLRYGVTCAYLSELRISAEISLERNQPGSWQPRSLLARALYCIPLLRRAIGLVDLRLTRLYSDSVTVDNIDGQVKGTFKYCDQTHAFLAVISQQ
nr:hypothetical protein CFP56_52158 [Quercus suber]